MEEPERQAAQMAKWEAKRQKQDAHRTELVSLFQKMRSEEENQLLLSLFSHLNEREKTALDLRYGIFQSKTPCTFSEIAKRIQCSASHARTIVNRAMEKLIWAKEIM